MMELKNRANMNMWEMNNMSNFQRRHYVSIAEVLAYTNANNVVINQFINMLQADNANFDRNRFIGRIAGLKSPVI